MRKQEEIIWTNSDNVMEIIDEIGGTPSRNEKIEILERAKREDASLLKFIFKLVYDNTINFGIKLDREEILELRRTPFGEKLFDPYIGGFLQEMSRRKYTRAQILTRLRGYRAELTPMSFRLLISTINKDLDANINTSTINKVFKGLIPTFPYMRCSLPSQVGLDTLPWEDGIFVQEKADGMFVNINTSGEDIDVLSRQGTPIPTNSPEFREIARIFPAGYQIHGEMLVRDKDGMDLPREIGNGEINAWVKSNKKEKDHTFVFYVWDCIPLSAVESKGRFERPYAERLGMLLNFLDMYNHDKSVEESFRTPVKIINTRRVKSLSEAYDGYQFMLSQGKEGVILKTPNAVWRDGTSKEQIKLKLECDCELEIVDMSRGEGKFSDTLGALVCKSSDGELIVNVSGFKDAMRNELWNNKEKYLNTIVTVRFNDVLVKEGQPASLFLPRFVEHREDRIGADSLQQILDIKNKAIGA